jgi:hypothetical protein
MRRSLDLICLLVLLASGALIVPASAQSPQAPIPTVLLAASAAMPKGKAAMVVVRPNASPREVIVIDPAIATAEDVIASLDILRHLPAFTSADTKQELRAYPVRITPSKSWPKDKGRYEKYLRDVRAASPRSVAGLGRVRAIDVPRSDAGATISP